jgi:hypothetical protein
MFLKYFGALKNIPTRVCMRKSGIYKKNTYFSTPVTQPPGMTMAIY